MTRALDGVDAVDWQSLGAAGDVPSLLQALTSTDSAQRKAGLDGCREVALPQDWADEATAACVPFLCGLAADPEVMDRHEILQLLTDIAELASVGYGHVFGDARSIIAYWKEQDDCSEELWHAYAVLAGKKLFRNLYTLAPLTADPDPRVRRIAARLFGNRGWDVFHTATVLAGRATAEQDAEARLAVVEGLGSIIGRRPSGDSETAPAAEALHYLACSNEAPAIVLTALAALARHAPALLPTRYVEIAVEAMAGSVAGTVPNPPPAVHTAAGSSLDALHTGLGERLAERHLIILRSLRHGDPEGPNVSVRRAGDLYGNWRVADSGAAAVLLGTMLDGPDTALALHAANELHACWLPLSPELLDHAAAVGNRPETAEGWTVWSGLTAGCIRLLARGGDARAVPLIVRLLAEYPVPWELPIWAAQLGSNTSSLRVVLEQRLVPYIREFGGRPGNTLNDGASLVNAALALRVQGAADIVLARLADEKDFTYYARIIERHIDAFDGAIGSVVPLLRRMLGRPEANVRVAAARLLWHIGCEPDEILPVLADLPPEPGGSSYVRWSSLELAASIGTAAAPLVPEIRAGLYSGARTSPAYSDPGTSLRAALALRAINPGDPEPDDVLRTIWMCRRHTRPLIAAAFRESGLPEAYRGLVRAELADVRRVGNERTPRPGNRCDCAADEVFLADCRALLEGAG